ncbi:hypothetical protein EBR21_09010 [bacterium]|nr:hypothetical protein [bacterium]
MRMGAGVGVGIPAPLSVRWRGVLSPKVRLVQEAENSETVIFTIATKRAPFMELSSQSKAYRFFKLYYFA